jgi:hypothetical protein
MSEVLTDQEIAATYVARGGIVAPQPLVRWLERHGLGHRNAASIAIAINTIQADSAMRFAPDERQFRDEIAEGTTATDADLAAAVAAMSLPEYAHFRAQAQLQPGVLDFLSGTA